MSMLSETPFGRRIRWPGREPLPVEPGPTRAVLARTFLYLYGAGGTLAVGSLLLPHSGSHGDLGIALPGLGAYVVAIVMLVSFERVPLWLFRLLPPLGTVLASIVVWSGGASLSVPYAGFYFWVVLSSFYLFEARWAWFNVAFVGAAFALVLSRTPAQHNRVLSWVMVMGALAVGGEVTGLLRSRLERLLDRTRRMVKSESLRRSIEAGERERRRWARELHDQTLQGLGALQMRLDLGLRAGPDGLDNAARAAQEQIAWEVENLRRIISDLRPALLDDFGLTPALEGLAERVRRGYNVVVSVNSEPGLDGPLTLELEQTIYRLVQEALANVCKHAHAHSAVVRLEARGGAVVVTVEDDGKGFDPDIPSEGFGLSGMRERVRLADGQLTVRSDATGTRVEAILPLGSEADAPAPQRETWAVSGSSTVARKIISTPAAMTGFERTT